MATYKKMLKNRKGDNIIPAFGGQIDTDDLADGAITTGKIADGAITTAKIADGALATVATTGSYNDLSNKPTIPTVNNATLTIQKNGSNVQTFTANSSTNKTANITVPTKTQLYSGGTSSTTTSTLSQAPSNFQYLLIDLADNDGNKFSIWVPAGNTYFTAVSHGYANNRIYSKWCRWQISGSTITRTYAIAISSHFYEPTSESNNIGIQRVYGVKFP